MCKKSADYILIGSGAGGTPAAAMLRRLNANFLWFEAGKDESKKLENFSHNNVNSLPTLWDENQRPTLKTKTITMSYRIPKTAGGQTAHYAGVNYWTLSDTMASTQISQKEIEVFEFVKNTTLSKGVKCDVYNPHFHTHRRMNNEPNTEDQISSTNACMYGSCKGTKCDINKLFVSKYSTDTEKDAINDWYRGSTITEYGSTNLQTNSQVQTIIANGSTITGVLVKSEFETYIACARKAVLLAAGIMGNAPIITTHRKFSNFRAARCTIL